MRQSKKHASVASTNETSSNSQQGSISDLRHAFAKFEIDEIESDASSSHQSIWSTPVTESQSGGECFNLDNSDSIFSDNEQSHCREICGRARAQSYEIGEPCTKVEFLKIKSC